ncbi:MAG: hypothetical protein PHN55_00855 [Dysgonamonadaceae bacterium]|nr:hypothetical protein [Dysgonamonadaceae bacterium]
MLKKYALLALLVVTVTVVVQATKSNKKAQKKDNMTNELIITEVHVNNVIDSLSTTISQPNLFRLERGAQQVADLWRQEDGSAEEYESFCIENFMTDSTAISQLFSKLERNFELFNGYFHNIDLKLKEPLHLEGPAIEPIDMMFGGYDVSAHLNDDMYSSKIAFITALNFPFFSLEEKTKLGDNWSREEWAFARMGDRFISRVPAQLQQHISRTLTNADAYISDYNIYMGQLLNKEGQRLFPQDMKLITHWGLRDELKSNYADANNGLEKQRMVYKVMQRIVDQTIPQQVINDDAYEWDLENNIIYSNGKEVVSTPEPDTRYKVFLDNFHAMRQLDTYSPHYPTQLSRAFDGTMEVPQKDVEKLFKDLLSSPIVKEVASFIESRLKRPLEPFDIWYNGFKSQEGVSEDELSGITSKKYPTAAAVEADLPRMLRTLGWSSEKAKKIISLITVDASRGAGHAWGASMRNDISHLRTRIGKEGMDYKGYNIAVHEFGHNVEQTITMNDVDYYMLSGVPNTAFTEAIAFLFQKRDLDLLGLKQSNPNDDYYLALDNFWSSYEVMGVSLVDIQVWEWLYAHPDATTSQLKDAVISISKDVWNTYYSEVLGGKDETLLGIYSHMIDYPLYLPNYPMGHLIDFQIEQQVRGKNMANEVERMLTQGSITPQRWMMGAVGQKISIDPLLNATEEALSVLK